MMCRRLLVSSTGYPHICISQYATLPLPFLWADSSGVYHYHWYAHPCSWSSPQINTHRTVSAPLNRRFIGSLRNHCVSSWHIRRYRTFCTSYASFSFESHHISRLFSMFSVICYMKLDLYNNWIFCSTLILRALPLQIITLTDIFADNLFIWVQLV